MKPKTKEEILEEHTAHKAHLLMDNGTLQAMQAYADQELNIYQRFQNLLANKILVEVRPIDSWDEWIYTITVEDCHAPFALVFESWPTEPFKTYQEAFEAGIKDGENWLQTPR